MLKIRKNRQTFSRKVAKELDDFSEIDARAYFVEIMLLEPCKW